MSNWDWETTNVWSNWAASGTSTWSVGNDEHPATVMWWEQTERGIAPKYLIGRGEVRVVWVAGTAYVHDNTVTRERLEWLVEQHKALLEYQKFLRSRYTLGKVEFSVD